MTSDGGIEIDVMTFNIRFDTSSDGRNAWPHRKDAAARIIQIRDVDLVGAQEVLFRQLNDLKSRLPNYASIGVGRSDGATKGEFSPILYKTTRFHVLRSGTFWLSEQPESPGVKGWDAACSRVATWGIFHEFQSDKSFLMMNTHLDHVGQVAQSRGADLILERIADLRCGLPVVLTGDLNVPPDHPVVAKVTDVRNQNHLVDAKKVARERNGIDGTWHNYGKIAEDRRDRIDYVFIDEGRTVLTYGVLPDRLDGVFLSDHAPVVAKLLI